MRACLQPANALNNTSIEAYTEITVSLRNAATGSGNS